MPNWRFIQATLNTIVDRLDHSESLGRVLVCEIMHIVSVNLKMKIIEALPQ